MYLSNEANISLFRSLKGHTMPAVVIPTLLISADTSEITARAISAAAATARHRDWAA